MKQYEIWSEGFAVTGQSSGAMWHTAVKANSFEEAILKYALENEEFYNYLVYRPNSEREGSDYTFWGCRIFDNEQDAHKSFG